MRCSISGLTLRLFIFMGVGKPVVLQGDSLRRGLSPLVTNEVVMIIEVKALGEWIVVSSFVGLLAFWRVRTLAHGAIVAI